MWNTLIVLKKIFLKRVRDLEMHKCGPEQNVGAKVTVNATPKHSIVRFMHETRV